MRKKLFALLLAACLLVGLIPAAYAQVIDREGYSFDTETGQLYIKTDEGSTQWREDPDIRKEDVRSVSFQRLGTPVLNVGPYAFAGCVNLTGTVKLNADATSIGQGAFQGCDQLELILIPEAAQGDIAAAGISERTAYVVYQYDMDADASNFFVKDVCYGEKTQVVFDGNIYDGTWSCGVNLVCQETEAVLPAENNTAWYYRTEDDGRITVTKYLTNPRYQDSITLPKQFGDLVVKEYAPGAFSQTGLTAENIIVVEEGIQAAIPEEVSKLVIQTENGSQVAYLTEGTEGSIGNSLHMLPVPREVSTLFLKDITASSHDMPLMMEGAAVSYTEDGSGNIVITNVTLGHFGMEQSYTVPTTVAGKPVTTVMINTQDSYGMDRITVDGSVNKVLYTADPNDASAPCTITQIVQGDQAAVELPLTVGGRPVESVPETAFDGSVQTVVAPEGLEVAQPEDVCKIVYTTDPEGNVTVTDIVPGRDGQGQTQPVTVPETIGGKTPVFSQDVQEEMATVPHQHAGGVATCTQAAECRICGQPYGEKDPANHDSLTYVAREEATCTQAGHEAYWLCSGCGKAFGDEQGAVEIDPADMVIDALGHDWNEPVYTWSEDSKSCTAERTCKNDGSHKETATAVVTGQETKAPTCTEWGRTTYTAAFTESWALSQTKEVADIPALGHDYQEGVCTVCGGADPDFRPAITAGAAATLAGRRRSVRRK